MSEAKLDEVSTKLKDIKLLIILHVEDFLHFCASIIILFNKMTLLIMTLIICSLISPIQQIFKFF